jgi:hypothetical protein
LQSVSWIIKNHSLHLYQEQERIRPEDSPSKQRTGPFEPKLKPLPTSSPTSRLSMQVRAYARDMEESLEQERIRLEEVVKMEIRARVSTGEALSESLGKVRVLLCC